MSNTPISEDMANKEKTWEKKVREGSLTKSIEVEQIENGFIIKVSKWGDTLKKDGTSEYINVNKKYFSKSNPLEESLDLSVEAENTAKGLGIDLFFE